MSTSITAKQQKNAVVYARVSSEEQVQGYSIQAQLRACREWAEKNGYTVAKDYLEEGHSAFRHLEKREALKELIADAVSKQRAFDTIIVHKLDRLFRNTLESSTTRAILKREKVRLISVTEPMVGSDTPENFLMEHLIVGMNEFYSKNLAREIRKGLTERIRQGFLVFRPPYGYRRQVIEKRKARRGPAPSADRSSTMLPQAWFEESSSYVTAALVTKRSPKSSTATGFEPLREGGLPATIFTGSFAIKRMSECSNTISVNGTAR